jgi:hypothetical protein
MFDANTERPILYPFATEQIYKHSGRSRSKRLNIRSGAAADKAIPFYIFSFISHFI